MTLLPLALIGALRFDSADLAVDAPPAPPSASSDAPRAAKRGTVLTLRTRGAPAARGSLAALLDSVDPALAPARLLRVNRLGIADLALPPGVDPDRCAARLAATGAFEFVEIAAPVERHGVPNDPGFASQWHLHNTGQDGGTIGADLGAAWAFEIEDGDREVVIAMIDSGVDLDHPDLAANFFRNSGEIPGNRRDDDRNGFVDDFIEVDFAPDLPGDPSALGHGTAVAGVIAAAGNNHLGVVGLAGGGRDGSGCALLPLRIGAFDADGSAIDDAILEAIDRGSRVICLPLGVRASRAIDLAIDEARAADVVVVASAGNGGPISYPAAHPWVIAVSGSTRSDGAAGFSAGPGLSVVAPSIEVLTTLPFGGYGARTGTSFAAPQVAALAGLVRSRAPALAASQVRAILERSATDLESPGFDETTGFGRVDAFRALRLARTTRPPRIAAYGRAVHPIGTRPPVITTNGVPAIAGDPEFAIVLADAPANRRTWLLIGARLDRAPAPENLVIEPSLTVLPLFTDDRGECARSGLLSTAPAIAGGRFFAQWIVEGDSGFATSRVLGVTVGD